MMVDGGRVLNLARVALLSVVIAFSSHQLLCELWLFYFILPCLRRRLRCRCYVRLLYQLCTVPEIKKLRTL